MKKPMKKWYIVTCRIAFEYEDALFTIEAASMDEAIAKAEQFILEDRERDDPDEEAFVLTSVVVTDSKPEILYAQ